MDKTISIFGWGLLWLAVLAACLATLVGFFGRAWWVFDLASHFRVQYFFFLLGVCLLFLIGRQYPGAALAAVFVLINLALILPLYRITRPAQAGEEAYRLLHINVLNENTAYAEVRQLIEEVDPDMIHLVEVNEAWLEELQPIRAKYPYEAHRLEADRFGVVIFSRYPLQSSKVLYFGGSGRPTLVADIVLADQTVKVIGTHPSAPTRQEKAQNRNEQIAEVAAYAQEQSRPVIVVGDLNITSWSPYFRVFQRSGLRDSRVGFGVQPTWPVDNRLVMVPIDHLLVSDGIRVHARRLGPEVGSDHLPVMMDFSLP